MNVNFLYKRTLDPNGAGPSLADLDDDKTPPPVPPTPPAGPDDLAKKQQEEEAAATAAAETAYQELLAQAVGEGGVLNPGYRLNTEGKVEVDPDYKPGEETSNDNDDDDDDQAQLFWSKVNELRGVPLEVEYPEGVDPLSPEGVLLRDKQVAAEAIQQWESYLQSKDARAYAYMLHRQNGGSDEDFLSEKTSILPSYTEFRENADLQMQVYKSELIHKGLDEETAQIVVDKALKDNKLFESADTAYKQREERDRKALQTIQDHVEQSNKEFQQVVTDTTSKITNVIMKGDGLNLVIPEADKTRFLNFVQERLEYDEENKEIILVERLAGNELPRKLEALYLLYRKGDLNSLIRREAAVQRTKDLRLRVQKSASAPAKSSGSQSSKEEYVPLGEL
jgi:hypothetical protein